MKTISGRLFSVFVVFLFLKKLWPASVNICTRVELAMLCSTFALRTTCMCVHICSNNKGKSRKLLEQYALRHKMEKTCAHNKNRTCDAKKSNNSPNVLGNRCWRFNICPRVRGLFRLGRKLRPRQAHERVDRGKSHGGIQLYVGFIRNDR